VSARADVSQRLVRHCEARGLLAGAARASTSRCRYTHDDIAVLRFVRRTHVLGFGMNETAQLLSLWRGGQGPEHVLPAWWTPMPTRSIPPARSWMR